MQLLKSRKYGCKPFQVVLVHGGPGAAGEMEPVAYEISGYCNVIEPFQTELTIKGQIEELYNHFITENLQQVVLIGFSWGAWLSYMFTSFYPQLVKKLILISSGPFEKHYAENIMEIRFNRFSEKEKSIYDKSLKSLKTLISINKNKYFEKIGDVISRIDAYNPIKVDLTKIDYQYKIYRSVWKEADELRESGKLLNLAKSIRCKVKAIHGDYDAHPAKGVEEPLNRILSNFEFVLLKNCGHKPWIEKEAKDEFYEILKNEIIELMPRMHE